MERLPGGTAVGLRGARRVEVGVAERVRHRRRPEAERVQELRRRTAELEAWADLERSREQQRKELRLRVEETYVRSAPGGTGYAKTGGNYAASLYAAREASLKGYDQVLWLDAKEKKYVEEVGTSNIFFVINGELVTPPLGGTILPGITRDTVLQLAKDWDISTHERRITIDEVIAAAEDGSLNEAFGSGTAAVISPIGEFGYKGDTIMVNKGKTGPLARRFFDGIQQLQRGAAPDPHNWIVRVK